jgi:hypothetical protein
MLIADSTTFISILGWGLMMLVWFAMVAATVWIALRKNRSPVAWGLFAMFFSLLALVLVAVLPSHQAGSG